MEATGGAMTIEELQVLISANTRELKKQIKDVKKQFKGLNKSANVMTRGIKSAFKKLAVGIAAIGLGKIIKNSIKVAMDAIESENLFDTVMGKWVKSVRAWSMELQKNLGLNAYEVRKNVGVLFNMTKSMGLAENSALDMSKQLTELAYDMASFYNISNEEAFNKLRAGITGETEPLKRLGILVHENVIKQVAYKNGIAQVGAQLTEQQKVMARYLAIMEQTGTAQGDLARTIKSPANQLRVLRTQLKLVRINLGKAFMPIWETILPALTSLAIRLQEVTSYFQVFMEALFGVEKQQNKVSKNAANISGGFNQMGKDIQEAGKKAKGSLSGFDEINQLAQNTKASTQGLVPDISNVATSGGINTIGEAKLEFKTNIDETKAKIQEQAENIKLIVGDLKTFIVENSDEIISALTGITVAFASFKIISNWTKIIEGVKLAFTGFGTTIVTALGAINLPVLAVAAVIGILAGTVTYLWKTNEGFRNAVTKAWDKIKQKANEVFIQVKEVVADLWETKLVPFANWLKDVLVDAWQKVIDIANWLWKEVLTPIGDFILWMVENVFTPLANILIDVLGTAFNFVKEVALILWENVLVPLGDFLGSIFQPLVEALSAVFTFLWQNVLKPLGSFIASILKPIFQSLIKVLEFLWKKVLKPLSQFIGGIFLTVFKNVAEGVKTIIGGFKTAFTGLMNFITGVFTGNWKKAWQGVKNIFAGVFNSLYGIVKVPLNMIIDAINWVISGLNKIQFELPDWAPFGLSGKSYGINIGKIPKLARGGIIDSPTLAMVGEAGKEAVVPLENTAFVDKLASAVGSAVLNAMQINNNNDSNLDGGLVLNIDGTEVARIVKPFLDQENNRLGDIITKPI